MHRREHHNFHHIIFFFTFLIIFSVILTFRNLSKAICSVPFHSSMWSEVLMRNGKGLQSGKAQTCDCYLLGFYKLFMCRIIHPCACIAYWFKVFHAFRFFINDDLVKSGTFHSVTSGKVLLILDNKKMAKKCFRRT